MEIKKKDMNLTCLSSDAIKIDQTVVPKSIRRLGRPVANVSRPLVVECLNAEDRLTFLRSTRNFKNLSETDNLRKVVIQPDRTRLEQNQHRELVSELKSRRAKGEEVMIRNDKIVHFNNSQSRFFSKYFVC